MRQPPTDATVRSLLNHLAGAVQRTLRMANAICAEFHPDETAALQAALLADQCEVPLHLVWIRRPDAGPPDTAYARAVARALHLPLVEVRPHPSAWVDGPAARRALLLREAAKFAGRLVTLRGARDAFADRPDLEASLLDDPPETADGAAAGGALQLRHPFEDANLRRFLTGFAAQGAGGHSPSAALEAALAHLDVPPRLAATT